VKNVRFVEKYQQPAPPAEQKKAEQPKEAATTEVTH
jgi:hypothetical protein